MLTGPELDRILAQINAAFETDRAQISELQREVKALKEQVKALEEAKSGNSSQKRASTKQAA